MERFGHAIGDACKRARERADRRRYEIAALLESDDPNRLRRFETGQTMPRDLDEVVRAYAIACDEDEHGLWIEAINSLHQNGGAQDIQGDPLPLELEEIITNVLNERLFALERRLAFGAAFQGGPFGTHGLDSRSVFDALSKGALVMTPEGMILRVNPALATLLNRSEEELLQNYHWQTLTHLEDQPKVTKAIKALIDGELRSVRLSEVRAIDPEDKPILLNLAASLFVDPATDEPLYIIAEVERA